MKYSEKMKFSREFINRGVINDERLFKDMVCHMVKKMPLSDIKKIFTLKKIDPWSQESEAIMNSNDPDLVGLRKFIRHLYYEQTVMFEAEIDI